MSDPHDDRPAGFNTRAAHTWTDGRKVARPLSAPIILASTYQVESSPALAKEYRERGEGLYTRFGNPTCRMAAARIAELEGAEAGLVFGSGMAAITTALLAVLKPGDHVVAQRNIFAQTFTFFDRLGRSIGIEPTFVDATDLDELRSAVREHTKLIYIETPSNPLLKVVDIAAVAEVARDADAMLFVDSTFASPYLQNPLELGATLVLHSATKYLGGHSDLTAGAAVGSRELIESVREMQIQLGGILDPHAAWLLLRGIKTLGVRAQRQSDTALAVAQFLSESDSVRAVHYPWLESSPTYALARRQMRGGGGVLSFEIEGELAEARAFLDALTMIPVATSLGGVETLIEIPAELDFGEEEFGDEHEASGVTPSLIRLAVGLEEPDDLIADLARGLRAVNA